MYCATVADAVGGEWKSISHTPLWYLCTIFAGTFYPGELGTVDAARLLWALTGCESSFGADCRPRHEMAYCAGRYAHRPEVAYLTSIYGHAAHCSYGPWQILLVNCGTDCDPKKMHDPSFCAARTCEWIKQISRRELRPKTVREWAQAWNGGHVGASSPGIDAYCDRLEQYYKEKSGD